MLSSPDREFNPITAPVVNTLLVVSMCFLRLLCFLARRQEPTKQAVLKVKAATPAAASTAD